MEPVLSRASTFSRDRSIDTCIVSFAHYLGEKHTKSVRVGFGGASGREVLVWAALLSLYVRLFTKSCGFFVQKQESLVCPGCGNSFRTVAPCLAKMEPF